MSTDSDKRMREWVESKSGYLTYEAETALKAAWEAQELHYTALREENERLREALIMGQEYVSKFGISVAGDDSPYGEFLQKARESITPKEGNV